MKITTENVKLNQELYDAKTGEVYTVGRIDTRSGFFPIQTQRYDGYDFWFDNTGYCPEIRVQLALELPLETIIERLQSHDWGEDSEDTLREVWAIVGGGE